MNIGQGLYRHYKGKIYMIVGQGKHTESLEEMVVYRAMYMDPKFGAFAFWIRPAKMFFEEVEMNGQTVPRFTKLTNEESVSILKEELDKIMAETNDQ